MLSADEFFGTVPGVVTCSDTLEQAGRLQMEALWL
jgi:hypothetical protein